MAYPKVDYVLFDMDGLMIDSESIYTIVTNKILEPYGKVMTWDIKAGCMGKPEHQAAEYLLSFFPDIPLTIESYLSQRNTLQDQLWPTVKLLPGVRKLVLHLHVHGIPMALATGSRRRNYLMKTERLGEVFDCFKGNVVCGDDVKRGGNKVRGKPNPDVFLEAANLLGKPVGENETPSGEEEKRVRACGLVFEDAIPGMQAGKRAGMSVVWVPDPNLLEVAYDGEEKADLQIESIEQFVPEEWGLPAYPEEPSPN